MKSINIRKILYFFPLMSLYLSVTSCNDWLDVQDQTKAKEEDFYAKKNGFKNALTGCYMTLADESIYGKSLTMSSIESLADLWSLDDYQNLPEQYYLMRHDYDNSYAKDEILAIYAKLFNVVTQANVIMKNVRENGAALSGDPQLKGVIEGEAYAIRALCQLDVLRMFGQMPNGGNRQVELPYCETTTIDEVPVYYGFAEYAKKIESDLERAVTLLGEYDPVMQYTFSQLDYHNAGMNLDEDFLYYRRSRLNYWAVKALQARFYLYVGNEEKAHLVAREIIDARGVDGKPVLELSGLDDIDNERWACPNECLFFLSKHNLRDYAEKLLFGGSSSPFVNGRVLVISLDMLQQMYNGVNISSHNRYRIWNRSAKNVTGVPYAATRKYYWEADKAGVNPILNRQIIPMLRMSEVYLIAMETSTDLAEVNSLYDKYMRSHNVLLTEDAFTSLDEVKAEMLNEYRREFYAEGQMFYTYKRYGTKNIMWYAPEMTESEYIVPLPDTEYNANK